VDSVVTAVNAARPGSYTEVEIPEQWHRHRRSLLSSSLAALYLCTGRFGIKVQPTIQPTSMYCRTHPRGNGIWSATAEHFIDGVLSVDRCASLAPGTQHFESSI